jgi:hypothetical protein
MRKTEELAIQDYRLNVIYKKMYNEICTAASLVTVGISGLAGQNSEIFGRYFRQQV